MSEITEPTGSGKKPERFLNKRQVGKRLDIKPRTIDEWMTRGLLPYYKLGRSVRFKWSEVEQHLAQTCRVCRFKHRFT